MPITLITEVEADVNTTEIDITGLDIVSHKFYLLIFTFKNPLAVICTYDIFFEGDFTSTNYYMQALSGSGTTVSAGRSNNSRLTGYLAGERGSGVVFIMLDPDGYVRAVASLSKYVDTIELPFRNIVRAITQTNLTRITIRASETNGIGAGSKVQIYGYTP